MGYSENRFYFASAVALRDRNDLSEFSHKEQPYNLQYLDGPDFLVGFFGVQPDMFYIMYTSQVKFDLRLKFLNLGWFSISFETEEIENQPRLKEFKPEIKFDL